MVDNKSIEDDLDLDRESVDNEPVKKTPNEEVTENAEQSDNDEEEEEADDKEADIIKEEENQEEKPQGEVNETTQKEAQEKSLESEVKEDVPELRQEEKKEDLEEIPLDEQPVENASPKLPVRPTRPDRPPRPVGNRSDNKLPTLQKSRSVTPNGNNNHLISQLKDAFPTIQTKILTAIVIASQNNIESCYDACLYFMDPQDFKPTFHPENFVPKRNEILTEQEMQLKRDEQLARDLDRKYNSKPRQSRTLSERNSRLGSGRHTRQYMPNENDDDSDDDFGVQRFIDSELPMMKENVSKTLRETSSKVGSWFKSFGDNSGELQKSKTDLRHNEFGNEAYAYDEWGNPIFQQNKPYKIVERSPGIENKVLPQRPSENTPSKPRSNSKPFINTPVNGVEKTPNANQQRSVSGSGNKRLVFVEPGENEIKPRPSVDDDLNLSD